MTTNFAQPALHITPWVTKQFSEVFLHGSGDYDVASFCWLCHR